MKKFTGILSILLVISVIILTFFIFLYFKEKNTLKTSETTLKNNEAEISNLKTENENTKTELEKFKNENNDAYEEYKKWEEKEKEIKSYL